MKRRFTSIFPRAAMTLLVMLLTSVSAWADDPNHKIVVIADPHVMGDGLQDDGTAWQNYLAGSRKLIDYSQALFDQAVSDIEGLWPKLVLIVGDLTKDGEQASHEYVKGKLDYLKNLGIPTLVIPGNHDLGTADAKIYNGDELQCIKPIEHFFFVVKTIYFAAFSLLFRAVKHSEILLLGHASWIVCHLFGYAG